MLGFLLLLLLVQDKPPEKCTLSGTVVNYVTGEPLDKVEITAEGSGPRGGSAGVTTSDAQGHFSLTNLDPANTISKASATGFSIPATAHAAPRATALQSLSNPARTSKTSS